MKHNGIELLGAERDEHGNEWIVSFRLSFRTIGAQRVSVRVPMSEHHDDDDKLSMADAAEKATVTVVHDLLLLARLNADILPEKPRERLISAFPQTTADQRSADQSED